MSQAGENSTSYLSNKQTMKTLVRLLLKQSDLGLHCLARPFFYHLALKIANYHTYTAVIASAVTMIGDECTLTTWSTSYIEVQTYH